ncbi:MAG: bifunctional methylenetetrahydrofolate dehydrogenase/methenyltetrahydrofolate cyclohydrolase FolD [Gammaproteobacteria bacterium]
MIAKLLDGKALSAKIQTDLATQLTQGAQAGRPQPGLAVILIGNNPASEIYVSHKRQACEAVGIRSTIHRHADTLTESALLALIDQLNEDDTVHGILIQLPLPSHINSDRVLQRVAPQKDVDGFHPYNVGMLALRQPIMRSCTPKGIMRLLASNAIEVKGLHAVVVGASNIVGRPLALELLIAGSTVTICHKFTQNLRTHVTQADLLVVAVGKPGLIPGEWVSPGAIVVDVGITRQADGRAVGDVEFDTASKRAAWITPVPGGVGPMTVAMLMENTCHAAGYTGHDATTA